MFFKCHTFTKPVTQALRPKVEDNTGKVQHGYVKNSYSVQTPAAVSLATVKNWGLK